MKHFAVIVAGGSGSRMGAGIPKQFRTLCGRPVLWWSMKAFKKENPDTELIIVLPEEFIALWEDFYSTLPESDRFPYQTAAGGKTRGESVSAGLSLINDEDSMVAVHDGARPLVTPEIISSGWVTAEKYGCCVPVIPVTDSLRKIEGNENKSVDRSAFVAVQTPQIFKTSILKKAYKNAGDKVFTDDASAVENIGESVALYEGSPDNIKITNPKDLAIASIIMSKDA